MMSIDTVGRVNWSVMYLGSGDIIGSGNESKWVSMEEEEVEIPLNLLSRLFRSLDTKHQVQERLSLAAGGSLSSVYSHNKLIK